jgi:hypothetical protein
MFATAQLLLRSGVMIRGNVETILFTLPPGQNYRVHYFLYSTVLN